VASVWKRQQVDSAEIQPDRFDGSDRERDRGAIRIRLGECPSKRHVRAPLARRGVASGGADDLSAGDDEPQVVRRPRDELLDESAVLEEPRLETNILEAPAELPLALAQEHVTPPAAETGLHHDRKLKIDGAFRRRHVSPSGVRDACRAEPARRFELVVGADQRVRAIQDADAAPSQRLQQP